MGVEAYADILSFGERRRKQPYDPWCEEENRPLHAHHGNYGQQAHQVQQAQMHRALQERPWQMPSQWPQQEPAPGPLEKSPHAAERDRQGGPGVGVLRSHSQHSTATLVQAPSFPDCFAVYMLVNKGAARRVREPALAPSGPLTAQRSTRGMGVSMSMGFAMPNSSSIAVLRSASSTSWHRAILPRTVTVGASCVSTPLGSTQSSVCEALAPWAEADENKGSSPAGGKAGGWWGLRRSVEEGKVERLQSRASVSGYGLWVFECLLVQYGPSIGEETLPEEALVQRTARLKALSEELRRLLQELHETLLRARHEAHQPLPSRREQEIARLEEHSFSQSQAQSQSREGGSGRGKKSVSFNMGVLDETSVEWDTLSTMTGDISTEARSVVAEGGLRRSVKTVVLEPVDDIDLVRVVYCGDVLCTLENGKAAYAPLAADQDPELEGFMDRIIVLVAEFYFSSY